jgi:hypothetical protein
MPAGFTPAGNRFLNDQAHHKKSFDLVERVELHEKPSLPAQRRLFSLCIAEHERTFRDRCVLICSRAEFQNGCICAVRSGALSGQGAPDRPRKGARTCKRL